jgi:hypothetical protein
MQVRQVRYPAVTAQPEELAFFNALPGSDCHSALLEMTEERVLSIFMVDDDVVTERGIQVVL